MGKLSLFQITTLPNGCPIVGTVPDLEFNVTQKSPTTRLAGGLMKPPPKGAMLLGKPLKGLILTFGIACSYSFSDSR
jgi:hypothetical protein